jgi:hypothetical protein
LAGVRSLGWGFGALLQFNWGGSGLVSGRPNRYFYDECEPLGGDFAPRIGAT